MRVFVTGATGFIGSAVVPELIGAGHRVLGLARSDAAAASLAAVGAAVEVHRGEIDDLDSLRRGAAAADGVIHTAFIHDFSNIGLSGEKDRRAIEAMGAALAESGRPFVVTSVMLHAQGSLGTEDSPPDPRTASPHRLAGEQAALALASQGVRASVVRLPPSVHGKGDYGFVPMLVRLAREKGVSAYIGEGRNRWPAVHRLDAAKLYRLALEKGAAGGKYHAVGDEGIPTRELAEVIGRHLRVPVASLSGEEAALHFSWLGRFFAHDIPVSSAQTQRQLGWHPQQPGLLEDLEQGHYFAS